MERFSSDLDKGEAAVGVVVVTDVREKEREQKGEEKKLTEAAGGGWADRRWRSEVGVGEEREQRKGKGFFFLE